MGDKDPPFYGDQILSLHKPLTMPVTNHLRTKTRLVLQSMLGIHDSIVDADAWQGYEGTPEQIETLMWEVYGILAKNPSVTDPGTVLEIWMEDYAAMHLAGEQETTPFKAFGV
mgnify:CR=1 FL=1